MKTIRRWVVWLFRKLGLIATPPDVSFLVKTKGAKNAPMPIKGEIERRVVRNTVRQAIKLAKKPKTHIRQKEIDARRVRKMMADRDENEGERRA